MADILQNVTFSQPQMIKSIHVFVVAMGWGMGYGRYESQLKLRHRESK